VIENVWERRVYLGDVQGQWTEACAATGTANNDNGLAIAHWEESGDKDGGRGGGGRRWGERRMACEGEAPRMAVDVFGQRSAGILISFLQRRGASQSTSHGHAIETTVDAASTRATACSCNSERACTLADRSIRPGDMAMLVNVLGIIGIISFAALARRCLKTNSATNGHLLICSTTHSRFFPVRHSFTYPLLYAFFRIDENIDTPLFAIDRWRILHVRTDDYLGNPPGCRSLHDKLKWHLHRHVRI